MCPSIDAEFHLLSDMEHLFASVLCVRINLENQYLFLVWTGSRRKKHISGSTE